MKISSIVKKVVFGIVLLVSVGGLVFVYKRVVDFDKEFQRIKYADEKVIESLVRIRHAEKAYLNVRHEYCDNWDSLVDFLANDNFVITSRVEHVHSINGKDSFEVVIDTLDIVPVYDSLRDRLNLDKDNLLEIANLPDEEGQFELWANSRGGQNFVEVKDPKPVNPRRKPDAPEELRPLPALKFGSKSSPSTKGNWE